MKDTVQCVICVMCLATQNNVLSGIGYSGVVPQKEPHKKCLWCERLDHIKNCPFRLDEDDGDDDDSGGAPRKVLSPFSAEAPEKTRDELQPRAFDAIVTGMMTSLEMTKATATAIYREPSYSEKTSTDWKLYYEMSQKDVQNFITELEVSQQEDCTLKAGLELSCHEVYALSTEVCELKDAGEEILMNLETVKRANISLRQKNSDLTDKISEARSLPRHALSPPVALTLPPLRSLSPRCAHSPPVALTLPPLRSLSPRRAHSPPVALTLPQSRSLSPRRDSLSHRRRSTLPPSLSTLPSCGPRLSPVPTTHLSPLLARSPLPRLLTRSISPPASHCSPLPPRSNLLPPPLICSTALSPAHPRNSRPRSISLLPAALHPPAPPSPTSPRNHRHPPLPLPLTPPAPHRLPSPPAPPLPLPPLLHRSLSPCFTAPSPPLLPPLPLSPLLLHPSTAPPSPTIPPSPTPLLPPKDSYSCHAAPFSQPASLPFPPTNPPGSSSCPPSPDHQDKVLPQPPLIYSPPRAPSLPAPPLPLSPLHRSLSPRSTAPPLPLSPTHRPSLLSTAPTAPFSRSRPVLPPYSTPLQPLPLSPPPRSSPPRPRPSLSPRSTAPTLPLSPPLPAPPLPLSPLHRSRSLLTHSTPPPHPPAPLSSSCTTRSSPPLSPLHLISFLPYSTAPRLSPRSTALPLSRE
ncbi:hypothetical protein FKM82_010638 [Ascaphus truei]